MNRYGECRAMTSESNYWQGCTSATATSRRQFTLGLLGMLSAPLALADGPCGSSSERCCQRIRLPPRAAEHGRSFPQRTGSRIGFHDLYRRLAGSEADVVRRMRVGQLNAAMMSVIGLSEIDPSVNTLQKMPMVFRSWEELDFVSQTLRPAIERRFRDKGFVVALWAEAGWVRFFCKEPRHARRI